MNRDQKRQEVEALSEKFKGAQAVFVTHYRGLSVAAIDELRRAVDKAGASYRVAKNTLLERATEGTEFEALKGELKGPNGLAFVDEDPAAVAKALVENTKKRYKLEVCMRVRGGNILSTDEIVALSKLPSREELLGQFVGVLAGPMRNLVGVLSGVPRSFVQVLGAIEEQKKAA